MDGAEVLIVDDDDSVRWILEEVLTLGKFTYDAVGSAQEAIERTKQNAYQLTIVDVKLGAMTGLELASRINRLDPKTQFLFVTGYVQAVPVDIGESLPVAGVLEKPFRVEDILSVVDGVLNARTKNPR